MEFEFATVIQAASGIACASLVNSTKRANRTSGIVQLLAGAVGGIGGGMAMAPLIADLLTGPALQPYSSMLGSIIGGALGGGALTIRVGAMTGGNRR